MSAKELRSRFVMAGGIRTHYSEVGDNGPLIIALHGGGAGSSGAAGAGPLMQALPDEFRVVALDGVGGYGLTDPAAPSPYGLQSRVDHLEDFVDALRKPGSLRAARQFPGRLGGGPLRPAAIRN